MATHEAITLRRAQATARLEAALATLGDRFALTMPLEVTRPPQIDPDLGRAQQLEAFAAVLEQIVAATAPRELPDEASPLVMNGIEQKHIDALAAAGLTSLEDVRNADDATLRAVPGIGPATIEKIRVSLDAMESKA